MANAGYGEDPSGARNADEVELGTFGERRRRQYLHAAAGLDGLQRLPDEMDVCLRELGEDLVRTGHVELGEIREEKKADLESHGVSNPSLWKLPMRVWGASGCVKLGVSPDRGGRGCITRE